MFVNFISFKLLLQNRRRYLAETTIKCFIMCSGPFCWTYKGTSHWMLFSITNNKSTFVPEVVALHGVNLDPKIGMCLSPQYGWKWIHKVMQLDCLQHTAVMFLKTPLVCFVDYYASVIISLQVVAIFLYRLGLNVFSDAGYRSTAEEKQEDASCFSETMAASQHFQQARQLSSNNQSWQIPYFKFGGRGLQRTTHGDLQGFQGSQRCESKTHLYMPTHSWLFASLLKRKTWHCRRQMSFQNCKCKYSETPIFTHWPHKYKQNHHTENFKSDFETVSSSPVLCLSSEW